MLVAEAPAYGWGSDEKDEYNAWAQEYYLALDITNNWRSSHNFPLNTFHIGLKRRAKIALLQGWSKRSVPTINIHRLMVGTAQVRLCPPL